MYASGDQIRDGISFFEDGITGQTDRQQLPTGAQYVDTLGNRAIAWHYGNVLRFEGKP